MASTMNKTWWVANKAKTLTDAGDTVAKALGVWDIVKKVDAATGTQADKADFVKIKAALLALKAAATALKAKANKTLHAATIKVLDEYVENCAHAITQLDSANGSGIIKNLENLPRAALDEIKKNNITLYAVLEENVLFLQAMKSGKGSLEIYNTFIKDGAKNQVNVSSAQRGAVDAAVKKGDFSGAAWTEAVAEVKKTLNEMKTQGLPAAAAKAEKTKVLRTLFNM